MPLSNPLPYDVRPCVYFLRSREEVKIGATKNDPRVRLYQIRSDEDNLAAKLIGWVPVDDPFDLERRLHARFSHLKSRTGKGWRDWFFADPELLAWALWLCHDLHNLKAGGDWTYLDPWTVVHRARALRPLTVRRLVRVS